jgi:hypothetical protein
MKKKNTPNKKDFITFIYKGIYPVATDVSLKVG